MSHTDTEKSLRLSWRNIGARAVLLLFWGAASVFYLLIVFPSVLSTTSVKNWIEKYAAPLPGVVCTISEMDCSWFDGVHVGEFRLQAQLDGEKVDLLTVDDFSLSVKVAIFRPKVTANIFFRGVHGAFLRYKDGSTNLSAIFPASHTPEKPSRSKVDQKQPQTRPTLIRLPFDLAWNLQVEKMQLRAEDRISGHNLAIENGRLASRCESILTASKELTVQFDIAADHQPAKPARLLVSIMNESPRGQLATSVQSISVDITGALPGSRVQITGGLGDQGIQGVVFVDLPSLFATIAPFLPDRFSNTQVAGRIDLSLEGKLQLPDQVVFQSRLDAENLGISGSILEQKKVHGVDLRLFTGGSFGLKDNILHLDKGNIRFLNQSKADFRCEFAAAGPAGHSSYIAVDQITLDIPEILETAKSFLPDPFPVKMPTGDTSPRLEINGVRIAGNLLQGEGQVSLENLDLKVPRIQMLSIDPFITAEKIRFTLSRLNIRIADFFPKDLDFCSGLQVETAQIRSGDTIVLKSVTVPEFKLQVQGIESCPKALLGYCASLSGIQQISVGQVDIPTVGTLTDIRQTLDAGCRLPPSDRILASVNRLDFDLADISIVTSRNFRLRTHAGFKSIAPAITIQGLDPPRIDVNGFKSDLRIAEVLELTHTMDIRASGEQGLVSKGRASVDLGRLLAMLPDKPATVNRVNGKADLAWQITGRRPTPAEIQKLTRQSIPRIDKDFGFLDQVRVDLSIRDSAADLHLTDQDRIQVGGLFATPLLRYDFQGKQGTGSLAGSYTIQQMHLSFLGENAQPVSIRGSFTGEHTGLDKLSLKQKCTIPELSFAESMDFTFSGLSAALIRNPDHSLPVMLKKAGVNLRGRVELSDLSKLNSVQDQMDASGLLAAAVNLTGMPSRSLQAELSLRLNQVHLERSPDFYLSGLSGTIDLSKRYRIADIKDVADQTKSDPAQENLSRSFLNTSQYTLPESGTVTTAPGSLETFNGSATARGQGLRFDKAVIKKGPLPLSAEAFQTRFALRNGLPLVHHLQMNLLGGSLAAFLSIEKQENRFAIPLQVSFSGIRTDHFLAVETGSEEEPGDTEVSGQCRIVLPVTAETPDFFSRLQVDVLLSHIGRRSLDRLLYALDPTESNEKIVSQRRLVRQGYPRWIRIRIQEGALSLEGVLTVKGVDVAIPGIRRLNLTHLSGLEPLEDGLRQLAPVIQLLEKAAANTILLDAENKQIRWSDDTMVYTP